MTLSPSPEWLTANGLTNFRATEAAEGHTRYSMTLANGSTYGITVLDTVPHDQLLAFLARVVARVAVRGY